MTVAELIRQLSGYDQDAEVCLDVDGVIESLDPGAIVVSYDPEAESTTVEIVVLT
jgi:hypothetical protein